MGAALCVGGLQAGNWTAYVVGFVAVAPPKAVAPPVAVAPPRPPEPPVDVVPPAGVGLGDGVTGEGCAGQAVATRDKQQARVRVSTEDPFWAARETSSQATGVHLLAAPIGAGDSADSHASSANGVMATMSAYRIT